jgi:hypothetical protein
MYFLTVIATTVLPVCSPRLWFDTEEEFFAAASKSASLYFLPERRIYFGEPPLHLPNQPDGAVYRIIQRGEESEIVVDNTGGAVYDAAIALSRYLAGLHSFIMHAHYSYILIYNKTLRLWPCSQGSRQHAGENFAGNRVWAGTSRHDRGTPCGH